LPEGQREIMDVVWDRGEVSAFEVREILSHRREVSRTAVRTTLERLEEKGWLTHRVIGRTHFYSPLITREASLGQRVVDFIDRTCGGQPDRLMAAIVDSRGLTQAEIERIEALLKQAKTRKGRRT
jgi:BlaI family transcriptional regulator, penicillinase repressor